MGELLCFAVQNVPRKTDGEGLPHDGSRTVAVMVGSCSGQPRCRTDGSGFLVATSS